MKIPCVVFPESNEENMVDSVVQYKSEITLFYKTAVGEGIKSFAKTFDEASELAKEISVTVKMYHKFANFAISSTNLLPVPQNCNIGEACLPISGISL